MSQTFSTEELHRSVRGVAEEVKSDARRYFADPATH